MTLLVNWFGFRSSCGEQGVGLMGPYGSFPTGEILWLLCWQGGAGAIHRATELCQFGCSLAQSDVT